MNDSLLHLVTGHLCRGQLSGVMLSRIEKVHVQLHFNLSLLGTVTQGCPWQKSLPTLVVPDLQRLQGAKAEKACGLL